MLCKEHSGGCALNKIRRRGWQKGCEQWKEFVFVNSLATLGAFFEQRWRISL